MTGFLTHSFQTFFQLHQLHSFVKTLIFWRGPHWRQFSELTKFSKYKTKIKGRGSFIWLRDHVWYCMSWIGHSIRFAEWLPPTEREEIWPVLCVASISLQSSILWQVWTFSTFTLRRSSHLSQANDMWIWHEKLLSSVQKSLDFLLEWQWSGEINLCDYYQSLKEPTLIWKALGKKLLPNFFMVTRHHVFSIKGKT